MNSIVKNFTRMTIVLLCLLASAANAQFFSKKTNELLPEEQAFGVVATIEEGVLRVNWSIAADYYMYRDQFQIASTTPGVEIGETVYPKGEIENDPEFGEVEVYFYNAELTSPIHASSDTIELTLKGQGCNKPVGVCYPPQTRILNVAFEAGVTSITSTDKQNTSSAMNNPSNNFSGPQAEKTFWGYVLAALGAGILLSFTPCVLPMIPILAGVIAGQQNPSRLQSGWLAICYVAGTIVTYAIAGWLAGASGAQLQAYFQSPWVIGFICSLLFLLAASLFGAFKIELPSSIQTKLSTTKVNGRSASISSFILGLISALVVGACVSPILIATLLAAIEKGDPVLGSAIMAAMALGMGLLLILFGFGAGWLLPKAGAWMKHIQTLFGFMVIGVAIYLISNFPSAPALYLWSALLLCTGYYLLQLGQNIESPLGSSVMKGAALAGLLWGAMALIGGASGGSDILKPLDGVGFATNNTSSANTAKATLPFQSVTTLDKAQQLLDKAKQANKPVLIDFYAEWCLDCKRMHKTTFREPSVISALADWDLVEIDVTETNKDSEEVKKFFSVFGPPATLFIKANGEEHSNLRQYGYMNEQDFLTILERTRG